MAEFGINATQLSDPRGLGANVVTPVQEPVPSNANELGALSQIADIFAKGIGIQQKQDAEARKQAVLARYAQEIGSVTAGFESGQLDASRTGAMTRTITSKYMSGFSEYADDLTKMSKGLRGETALSEAEDAVKAEKDAYRRKVADAERDGFIFLENGTPETNAATIRAHQVGVRAKQEFQEMAQRNAETRAQGSFDATVREREQKDMSFRLVNEVAGANLEDFQAMASELSKRVAAGMPYESARLLLGARMSNIDMALTAAARVNPELAAGYVRVFKDLGALGQQLLDPKNKAEDAKAEFETLIAKTKLMAVQTSVKVRAAVANSELFRGNPEMAIAAMPLSQEAFAIMSSTAVDAPLKGTSVIAGDPQVEKEVLGMLKSSLGSLAKGNHPRKAIAEVQAGNTVNQVMKQLGNLMNTGTVAADELLPVVGFLASPEFAAFSKNGQVDRPTALAARRTLQVVMEPKLVRDVTAKLEAPLANSPSSGKAVKSVKDLIAVNFSNGGVSFSLKEGARDSVDYGGAVQISRVLSQMKVAEALINQFVKANAHLDGRNDYQAFWEETKHVFFPGYFPKPETKTDKPPVKTEAQMRVAATLTPEEMALDEARSRSPASIAELEGEIARTKVPAIRAILEAELKRLKGQ